MANNGGPLKPEDEGTKNEGITDEGTSGRDRIWMPTKMNLKKIICLLLMILILMPIMRIKVFYHEDPRYIMIIWTLNQEDRKELYEGITGCLQKLQLNAYKNRNKGRDMINMDVEDHFNNNNKDLRSHQVSWSSYIRRKKLLPRWLSKFRKQHKLKEKEDGVNLEKVKFHAQENNTKYNRSLATDEEGSITMNNECITLIPLKQKNQKEYKNDEATNSQFLGQEDPKQRHEYIQTQVSESNENKIHTKRKDVTNTDGNTPLNTNNDDVRSNEVTWSWYIRSKKLLLRWLSKFRNPTKLEKKDNGVTLENIKLDSQENNTEYKRRMNTVVKESFNKCNEDVTRHQVSWSRYIRCNKLPLQWLSKSRKQNKMKKKEDRVVVEIVMFDSQENNTRYNRSLTSDEKDCLTMNEENITPVQLEQENEKAKKFNETTKYTHLRQEDSKKRHEDIQREVSESDGNKLQTKRKDVTNTNVNEPLNTDNEDVISHGVRWSWYIRSKKLLLHWLSKLRNKEKLEEKEDGVTKENVKLDGQENNTKCNRSLAIEEEYSLTMMGSMWKMWLSNFTNQAKLKKKKDGVNVENVKFDANENNTDYNIRLSTEEKDSHTMNTHTMNNEYIASTCLRKEDTEKTDERIQTLVSQFDASKNSTKGKDVINTDINESSNKNNEDVTPHQVIWSPYIRLNKLPLHWLSKSRKQDKLKKKEDEVNTKNVMFHAQENNTIFNSRLSTDEKNSHMMNNEYIAPLPIKQENQNAEKVDESTKSTRLTQEDPNRRHEHIQTEVSKFNANKLHAKGKDVTNTDIKESLNTNNEDVTRHQVSWSWYKRSKKLLLSWLSKFMKQAKLMKKEDGFNVENAKFDVQQNNTKHNRRISHEEEPLHNNSEDVTSKQTKDDYLKKQEKGVCGENEQLHKDVDECFSKGETSTKKLQSEVGFTPAENFGPTCFCGGSSAADMIQKLQSEVEELKAKLAVIDDLKAELTLCKISKLDT